MIEMNNLITNLSATVDPTESIQETSISEQLSENNEDQADEELSLDSNSFMLMMAQILSSNSTKSDDSSNAINSNKTEYNSSSQTNTDAKSSPSSISVKQGATEIAVDTANLDQLLYNEVSEGPQSNLQKANSFNNNVAMAWINSESYIPPQSTLSPIEVEEQSLPELNTLVESKLTDELPTKKIDNATNSSENKIKEDLFQSLQTLGAVVSNSSRSLDTVLDTQQKAENIALNNDQDVIYLNSTQQNSSNPIAPPKTFNIPVEINSPQWTDKFSEHIIWMGQQGIKSALIKLHPDDLGPLEISIKVVKNSASVNINSHSSHVRDIVEQAIPRLREMMTEQGLHLSEAHIGGDTNSRQAFQQPTNSDQAVENHIEEDDVLLTHIKKRPTNSLIDYFA